VTTQKNVEVNDRWVRKTLARIQKLPAAEARREWMKCLGTIREGSQRRHPHWRFPEHTKA